MSINAAGISALLDDGNEAPIYVAIGDGPAAGDQVSVARVQLVSSVAASVLTATGVPYSFTGTPLAAATHALLFSAASAGTFYGFVELAGDQAFSAGGEYNLTSLTITGLPAAAPALGSGQRAAPGTVGYLGGLAELTRIQQSDDLTGTPFEGADWFPGVLVVGSNSNLDIEGYWFDGVALFFTGSGNHEIRHCVIDAPDGQAYGLGASAHDTATILIEDTTITFAGNGTAVGFSRFMTMTRCDVSGGENSVAFYSFPAATFADAPTLSQCYFHDQLFNSLEQHVDAIEVHQDATDATKLVIEGCYITGSRGPGNVPISAGITMGEGSGSTSGILTPKIDNCYIGDGTYHLRIEFRTANCVVTDNNFGALSAGEFGFHAVSSAPSIATWTGNVDGNGDPVAGP